MSGSPESGPMSVSRFAFGQHVATANLVGAKKSKTGESITRRKGTKSRRPRLSGLGNCIPTATAGHRPWPPVAAPQTTSDVGDLTSRGCQRVEKKSKTKKVRKATTRNKVRVGIAWHGSTRWYSTRGKRQIYKSWPRRRPTRSPSPPKQQKQKQQEQWSL